MSEYDNNVKKWKKAYSEILSVCEKYPGFFNVYGFRDIDEMSRNAESHLMLIDWYEKYGLKISHDEKPAICNYFNQGDNVSFLYFKDGMKAKESGSGRFISWSDDDRQPEDEWLLKISFPTGAYIFGQDYATNIFEDFFKELKTYGPEYLDTMNSSLYFKLENAKKVYENFYSIKKKYQDRYSSEAGKRRADELRKELANLEAKEPSNV